MTLTRDIKLSLRSSSSDHFGQAPRKVSVERAVMARNNAIAEQNREHFKRLGILTLNLMSSPGSGKTTFLIRTFEHFGSRANIGVIVGDLATERDADRLSATGVDTVQIQTGNVCHLEADMIARASVALGLAGRDLVVIENVGNLVCPAGYDLGEDLRVVLLSTTEGEDKPLKYPKAFRKADVVVINKIDLSQAVKFDRPSALEFIRSIAPQAVVFEVSAMTGQGMEQWYAYLASQLEAARFELCELEHSEHNAVLH
jgi:hydrogenase nickel incorporation protein HypB